MRKSKIHIGLVATACFLVSWSTVGNACAQSESSDNWGNTVEVNSLRAPAESQINLSPQLLNLGDEIRWQVGDGSLTSLVPEGPLKSIGPFLDVAPTVQAFMLAPSHDSKIQLANYLESPSSDTPKFGLDEPTDEFLIIEEIQSTDPKQEKEATPQSEAQPLATQDEGESATQVEPDRGGTANLDTLRKTIEQRRSEVNADEKLDDALKSARLETLAKASNFAQQTAQFKAKATQFAVQLEDFGNKDKRNELNRLLKEVIEPDVPRIDSQTTTESLTAKLQLLQQEQESLQSGLDTLNKNMNELNDRVSTIPGLRDEAEEELADIKTKLEAFEGADDFDIQLNGLLQTARLMATQAKIEMLDKEAQRQGLAGKILPLQRDLETRKIAKLASEIEHWETAIINVRNVEVEQQRLRAELEKRNAHPALKTLAKRNEELAKLRESITSRLQLATDEAKDISDEVKRVIDSRTTLEGNIEAGAGLTTASGLLLVEHRRNLIAPWESLARISSIETESKKMNIAVLQLEEERKPLANPGAFVETQLNSPEQVAVITEDLTAMGFKFAETQRQLLDDLIADYNNYRSKLRLVAVEHEKLVKNVTSLRSFIDQNALWIQSAEPIKLNDFRESQKGLSAFFNGKRWFELADQLKDRVAGRPHESALGAFGMLVLMLFSRRLRHTKEES